MNNDLSKKYVKTIKSEVAKSAQSRNEQDFQYLGKSYNSCVHS